MKQNQIQNIRNERYEKQFQVEDDTCRIVIEDACYGDWKDRTEVLDEVAVEAMCKGIAKVVAKYVTKYNPLPEQIIIRHGMDKGEAEKERKVEEQGGDKEPQTGIFSLLNPRYQLSQVALPGETREQLAVTLSAIRNQERLQEWGMSATGAGKRAMILNFYGQAGTGKSMTAEAIAAELGKKCLIVNYSELESKYVGETPKNIKKVFETAARDGAVLVFDEADSFLSKRLTNITQSADYAVNIARSVMLMELERFEGIVVFTTNLMENYDTAFQRRIFASIEFALPDETARAAIWKLHMGDKLPIEENVSAEKLAQTYQGVSGADIKDMVYYAAVYAIDKKKEQLGMEDFEKAFQYVMKRYG